MALEEHSNIYSRFCFTKRKTIVIQKTRNVGYVIRLGRLVYVRLVRLVRLG